MNQTAINYATALYELSIPGEAVDETAGLFAQAPQLQQVLSSPVTSLKEKHAAIVRIFPPAMQNFLKELCDNQASALRKKAYSRPSFAARPGRPAYSWNR